jgi:ribosomal protein L16 Arg81 hydroxylase
VNLPKHIARASVNFEDWLTESYEWGFGIHRQIYRPNPTALEVVDQYQWAKKHNWLTKEDEANYNNRWLQFVGDYCGQFSQCQNFMNTHFGCTESHIYGNWKTDGHNYGRHIDDMDVILVQMWNRTAYTVESDKQHSSFTLSPGDALYIRAGVYHTPIILEERATMSFSWK